MTHNDVYKKFASFFPDYASDVDLWFPNGKNSVRIRSKGRAEFVKGLPEYVFTYNGDFEWSFETIKNHLSRTKNERR